MNNHTFLLTPVQGEIFNPVAKKKRNMKNRKGEKKKS